MSKRIWKKIDDMRGKLRVPVGSYQKVQELKSPDPSILYGAGTYYRLPHIVIAVQLTVRLDEGVQVMNLLARLARLIDAGWPYTVLPT